MKSILVSASGEGHAKSQEVLSRFSANQMQSTLPDVVKGGEPITGVNCIHRAPAPRPPDGVNWWGTWQEIVGRSMGSSRVISALASSLCKCADGLRLVSAHWSLHVCPTHPASLAPPFPPFKILSGNSSFTGPPLPC